MFDVVKNIKKNEVRRQFTYNRVPVKLNEGTKQIKQNILKNKLRKKICGKH